MCVTIKLTSVAGAFLLALTPPLARADRNLGHQRHSNQDRSQLPDVNLIPSNPLAGYDTHDPNGRGEPLGGPGSTGRWIAPLRELGLAEIDRRAYPRILDDIIAFDSFRSRPGAAFPTAERSILTTFDRPLSTVTGRDRRTEMPAGGGIPEPGTAILLGAGLLILLRRR